MRRELLISTRGRGSYPLDCEFCDLSDFDFNGDHEGLGAAIAEAGDRGIDTDRPFTLVWDRLAYTLEVSQEQPEDA